MRWWVLVPLSIIVIAVQSSLLMPLTLWGVLPDLALVIVATVALVQGPAVGGLTGLIAGLLLDVIAGRMVGLGALSKVAVGLGIGAVGQRVFGERIIVTAALVFVAAFVDRIVYYVGARAFGIDFGFTDRVIDVVIPSALYESLISLVAYPLIVRIMRWIAAEQRPKKAMRSGLDGG